jgi:hypothetical protein
LASAIPSRSTAETGARFNTAKEKLTFERTRDLGLVRSILTHPGIWPYIGDDFAGEPQDFHPNEDERIWYVLAIRNCRIVGLFMFVPETAVCWAVHVVMERGIPPLFTHEAGREIIPWIWAHTDCRRLVAHVPATNRAALHFGLRVMGLRAYGRNKASFLKHGHLIDQVDMGISRPEN